MSRYEIMLDDHCMVTVGWDNPGQTFFARVDNLNKQLSLDENIYRPELWVGFSFARIQSIFELQKKVVTFFTIPAEICVQLENDRKNGSGPTPLQQMMNQLFEKN